jgi:putative NADPH-quinone reductase
LKEQRVAKKIVVILGHPAAGSLCGAMASTYVDSAREAGAEVRLLELGALRFNPVLGTGHDGDQLLEPDLVAAQADLLWAEHLVWVYPIWWGAMPALMKGFIDRVLLPGFAFKYRQGSSLWDKLLLGRTAELLVTMDSPPWYFRWVTRMPGHHQMKKAILEFCGISPVRVHNFGPVRTADAAQRSRWLAHVVRLGMHHKASTAAPHRA